MSRIDSYARNIRFEKTHLLLNLFPNLPTLILAGMRVLLNIIFYFCILFPLLKVLILAQESRINDYKEKQVMENFEDFNISNLTILRTANTNYLPEVKLSKNLTSPDLISKVSLLIRISSGETGIPFDLKFTNPYSLEGYANELEFYIYSNNANGELFLYLLDCKFQKHKIKIASLNFEGWKKFIVPIGNNIFQSDFIIGKSIPIKVTGIQISTIKKESKQKEDIIVLDDILWTGRIKYRIPSNELEGIH
jgi:hypothetical protein